MPVPAAAFPPFVQQSSHEQQSPVLTHQINRHRAIRAFLPITIILPHGFERGPKLRLGVVYMWVELPEHILPHEHCIAVPPELLPGGVELQELNEIRSDC